VRRGAFGIALRHPSTIAAAFSAFSHQIAQVVPAVIYGPEHIHTSLAGTPFEEPFLYSGESAEHKHTLARLVSATERALVYLGHKSCNIHYDTYLYTPQAVLARGNPDKNFCDLLALLEMTCGEEGLQTRLTWGSHVTVSRFAKVRAPHELGGLLPLLEGSVGPGLSVATQVSVGYSLWGPSPECPKVDPSTVNGHFVAHRTFDL